MAIEQRTRSAGNTEAGPEMGRIAKLVYVARTAPGILKEAMHSQSGGTLVDRIGRLERHRLETHLGVTVVEPGSGIEMITDEIEGAVYDTFRNPSDDIVTKVDDTTAVIRELTHLTPADVRIATNFFTGVPQEHIKFGVKRIEKFPMKRVLGYIKERAQELDGETDRELADVLTSYHLVASHGIEGSTAAMYDHETSSVAMTDREKFLAKWAGAHEVGHGVFTHVLTDKQREEWERISVRAVSSYAKEVTEDHKADENFSEMYAMYLHNRPFLKLWSMVDEDMKQQYEFFKGIMPKRTRVIPTAAGIVRPIIDHAQQTGYKRIEAMTSLPLSDVVAEGADVYRPDFGEEQLAPETLRKIVTRADMTGNADPRYVDRMVMMFLAKEFVEKNMPLLHRSKRMEAFLKRNGIWNEAIAGASTEETTAAANGSETLLAAIGLAVPNEHLQADIVSVYPVFLKNRLLLITPQGRVRVPYTQEVKQRIRESLPHDSIYNAPSPISEVQLDAVRALKEPDVADLEAKELFEQETGIKLLNSDRRGFSAMTIARLQRVMQSLPTHDYGLIPGFYRVANGTDRNIAKGVSDSKRFVINLDDIVLTLGDQELLGFVAQYMGRSLILHDSELSDQFAEISGWQRQEKKMRQRIGYSLKHRGIPNKVTDLIVHSGAPEDFISASASLSLVDDFSSSYKWFVTDRESFQQRAANNPALQAKFDIIAEHFEN